MAAKKEARKHQPSHTRYWSSKKNEANKLRNIYKQLASDTALVLDTEWVKFPDLGTDFKLNDSHKDVRLRGRGAVAVVRAIRLGVNVKDVLEAIKNNNWKRVLLLVGDPNKENLDYRPATDKARKNLQNYNPRQYKKIYGQMRNFYKYRALSVFTKQQIAKYYGIKTSQLQERHYYCYYQRHFVSKFVGVFRQ